MATMADLPLRYRLFMATYRFRKVPPGLASLRKPLGEARVALVTTAGLCAPGEPPFDLSMRGGDPSFRIVPFDAPLEGLLVMQRSESFDHAGIEADRNLGFPRDRLREMAVCGEIGSAAPRHLSFMGAITAPGRLVKETAPRAAEILVADGVDAALLVPL